MPSLTASPASSSSGPARASGASGAARVRWGWIRSARADLVWYVGSALAGWSYAAVVLGIGRGLDDPVHDAFYTLAVGDLRLPLTLGLLVVASWALLIDAPHVWATLARTWLDPDEWATRRDVLLRSTAWFALGPVAVFGPYLLGSLVPLTEETMALGASLFFVFFRLWAYYHVVRQHWGFLVLYKRRNGDVDDPLENRADAWFFHASLYLPVVLLVSAPWYEETGLPPLGLDAPLVSGITLGSILHPLALLLYPIAIASYAGFQIARYRRGAPRNGPKLLLLLSIVPLHLVVFLHPLLALFVVPIVTVGHNLQYHRIVWDFGRSKYVTRREPGFRWARASFHSPAVYLGAGLLFTFALYQGPWVDLVKSELGYAIDSWLVGGLGMVAGVSSPVGESLGASITATLFLGWAMQHYYLDSRIWRVRRDPAMVEHLGLARPADGPPPRRELPAQPRGSA